MTLWPKLPVAVSVRLSYSGIFIGRSGSVFDKLVLMLLSFLAISQVSVLGCIVNNDFTSCKFLNYEHTKIINISKWSINQEV